MSVSIQKLTDLTAERPIHLSGIGGSAMNGLALLLRQNGFQVHGTDPAIDTATAQRLADSGITVSPLQDGSTILPDTQLLVATAALPMNHPELSAAAARDIPVLKYAAMLGVVMNSNFGIAVAGTHGKTSTSALIVSALRGAGLDPGFVIGGFVSQFNAGAHGGKDYLVAEACEYDRSFLNLHPNIAVVTNIEADHLDIYAGINEIVDSFEQFIRNMPPEGTLIYCAESPAAKQLASRFEGNTVSYGLSGATYTAIHIRTSTSSQSFDIHKNGVFQTKVNLQLPGEHNVLNALAAYCVGNILNCKAADLSKGLAAFSGVKRRFERIGRKNDIDVIDDYAHHPTEIRALLKGAKERFVNRRLVVAFQPHQISRTQFFFDEFAAAFGLADEVFLPDIYIARDKTRPAEVTSENLAKRMQQNGTRATYTGSFENTAQALREQLRPGDVFLSVGAGNIYEVAHRVIELLS